MKKQKIILIVGPTAVGKTALSIELAHQFKGEVISGDSMQVYRQLDIGTAKIRPTEMQGVPHHLLDIQSMTMPFTVADFQNLADQAITEITQRGHQPFVVGGTGFYLQSLLRGYQLGGAASAASQAIRDKWQQVVADKGVAAVQAALMQVDPISARKIPAGDSRRLIRALEVFELTGKPISAQTDQQNKRYEPFIIGLTTQRQQLYRRIDQRVTQMMAEGLLTEAKLVYSQCQQAPQASKAIGYKEFFPYFAGEIDLATAVAKVQQNSRHFAKRQLTFFRNQMATHWYDLVAQPEQFEQIKTDVTDFLTP
ncbi:tRNA (adenosine(37)-N6)-dimethylallyltransferase MiaA [Loigolactobacillus coryniformis]|uniref:tRNA (adenosine(37)-N6)-dimethylallyltransferase MiaA n=1 Tax=Loigolactobacillus coryniformis TaxID=1610 RepID=UPI001C5FEE00|nr:tRNA (adenosine(37)-N6)-dimethylallyltransferase MiaA [Loigolactobacillus coryniformis]MBW4802696.1 tRNA (adenosine(37)-N6)-dimethylallyltransferase MiaA [Loigolactobacillus coryniformis subsp. torquens]MBW4805393.1 tRNA (adenosine(37)-N6)-dimethylallyltransferase MiaA [Loigolactobacillus coryniformis subsp. torquens]